MGRKAGDVKMPEKQEEKERERAEREIERLEKKAKHSLDKEDYSKAVSLFQEMSRIAKSIEDKRSVDFCIDAARYSSKLGNNFKVGWCYKCAADHSLALKDYNNAINFAEKAIKHFEKANSMYVVQWCYNIIGFACEKIRDFDLALKNYKKSLEIEYSEDIDKKVRDLKKIKNKAKDKNN